MNDKVRLNKYIGASGFCSRRKADEWIAAGKVSVNGKPADMGMRVNEDDEVVVAGKIIKPCENKKIVAFYKPEGFACTSHRGDASAIFANFPLDKDLKYIGRLDKDSEGLLLLTNDGDLCNEVAKARNMHEKEYLVTVNKTVTKEFLDEMAGGVPIYDANRDRQVVTRPCVVKKQDAKSFTIILTQGYNRQIRRMCEYFEYRVIKLSRIRVMNVTLGDLKPGQIRELTLEEVDKLRKLVSGSKGKK
ncbi:MAG: pseudouridine synthase [Lachnospiraceae bacterium]|nr:pseudouridine synthase [Lachnospiraceae bacterium]